MDILSANIEKFRKKCFEEGFKEGFEESKLEGRKETKIEIAKKMIGYLKISEIANITGLTEEEIKKLIN